MITADELIARSERGSLRLLLDTNAVFSHRRLAGISSRVNRLNDRLGAERIGIFVSAVVHAEKLFDLKQVFADRYDEARVMAAVRGRGLGVLPFEEAHARELARLLGQRFPDPTTWHRAKRQRCLDCLGIKDSDSGVPGSGRECGATVDWLIAAHALAEGCILVTNDRDPEFDLVADKLRLEDLEQALARMLESAASMPPGAR